MSVFSFTSGWKKKKKAEYVLTIEWNGVIIPLVREEWISGCGAVW